MNPTILAAAIAGIYGFLNLRPHSSLMALPCPMCQNPTAPPRLTTCPTCLGTKRVLYA